MSKYNITYFIVVNTSFPYLSIQALFLSSYPNPFLFSALLYSLPALLLTGDQKSAGFAFRTVLHIWWVSHTFQYVKLRDWLSTTLSVES